MPFTESSTAWIWYISFIWVFNFCQQSYIIICFPHRVLNIFCQNLFLSIWLLWFVCFDMTVVDRIMSPTPLKDDLTLTPGTYDYVTLHRKRNFSADVIKLRSWITQLSNPRLSRQTQCNHTSKEVFPAMGRERWLQKNRFNKVAGFDALTRAITFSYLSSFLIVFTCVLLFFFHLVSQKIYQFY